MAARAYSVPSQAGLQPMHRLLRSLLASTTELGPHSTGEYLVERAGWASSFQSKLVVAARPAARRLSVPCALPHMFSDSAAAKA